MGRTCDMRITRNRKAAQETGILSTFLITHRAGQGSGNSPQSFRCAPSFQLRFFLHAPILLKIVQEGPLRSTPPALCLPVVQTEREMWHSVSHAAVVGNNDEDVLVTIELLQHSFRAVGHWDIVSERHVIQRVVDGSTAGRLELLPRMTGTEVSAVVGP